MAQSKVEHLQRMLAVVHKIDRGSARANRTALRSSRDDGSIPLDLLATAPYERVVALLGPGDAPRRHSPKVSVDAMPDRTPRPPEELVGALQDRVHAASGRLLAVKPVRVGRRN